MPRYRRRKSNGPIPDRICSSLRQRLCLLHRFGPTFFILGATGNVYTVTLSSTPSCTCPDSTILCKHIFFVLIRVLDLHYEDSCLRRRTYAPSQQEYLLSHPTSEEWLAGDTARERFHELSFAGGQVGSDFTVEEGATCPMAICLDGIMKDQKLVAYGTCGTRFTRSASSGGGGTAREAERGSV